ncbi:MAG: hypothetical protein IMF14_07095, partial [Proteobacteria bacterium]|nr:hypothetical protein [Pseudomonadota bacterium]
LAKTVPEALDEFVSAREELLKLSEEVSAEDLHLFYQIALIGRRDLPLSPDARNGFEMVLLRMLAFRPAVADVSRIASPQSSAPESSVPRSSAPKTAVPSTKPSAISPNVQPGVQPSASSPAAPVQTSQPPASQAPVAQPQNFPQGQPQNVPPQVRETPPVQSPAGVSSANASSDWREVVNALGLGGLVKQLAINCTMKQRDGCNIVLQIETGHSNLINAKAKQRLQQALGEYFNIDAQLHIEVAGQIKSESPAQTIKRETVQRQQQAEQSIDEDSFTRSLKETFNAEIIPGSVKPVT